MPSDSQPVLQASDAPAFPRAFGPKYVFLKEIGAGGMGRVFMALSGAAGMQRVCAIKTISFRDDGIEAAQLAERFTDEARVVTQLEHRNLVYVFDAGLEGGEPYIAMEYVRGKPLRELLERLTSEVAVLPLGLAMHIALELTSALDYVHAFGDLGLVHRDVSPANLMLSYTGTVKLIDFGVAKWRNRPTRTQLGLQWGKHGYRAPEQLLGSVTDRRTDLYAAGIIFWEMLAGRRLFADGEQQPLRPEIPPPSTFNSKCPLELDRVVLKAVATDPPERFQSAPEMHAAISKYLPHGDHATKLAALLGQWFAREIASEDEEESRLVAGMSAISPGALPTGPAPQTSTTKGTRTDPIVGTVLGERYEVLRLIGRGGMGAVYEAFHRGIGKRVALKIHNSGEGDSELVQRLMVEAVAAGRLEHPNVARVTDSGTTQSGAFFFVMEYLDGVGLDRIIHAEAPMDPARALEIAVQVCRAVAATHHAGIVHRDLKPSNVMLVRGSDGKEQVKVLDFGLAKLLHPHAFEGLATGAGLTRPEIAIGTPLYMAPEQIVAGADVDGRADLYAIAAILYEMLTGHAPHEADDPEEICRRKIAEPAPDPRSWRPDLRRALASVLIQSLAREPDVRPQSADELEHALRATMPRPRPHRRSMRALLAASAAGMGLTVAAGILWPMLTHRRQQTAASPATVVPAQAGQVPGPSAGLGGTALGTGVNAPAVQVPTVQVPGTADATAPTAAQVPGTSSGGTSPPGASTSVGTLAAAPPGEVAGTSSGSTASGTSSEGIASATGGAGLAGSAPAGAAGKGKARAIDEVGAHMTKARALFRDENLADALAEAREAVRLGGGARAYVLLGSIHLRRGDYSEAEHAYESALKLDPGNDTALRGRDMAQEHR